MVANEPKTGLRERKKERTRKLIRHHALRLVSEHGYAATTVDQIADACEISPSTFFRYFKNKDDAITHDFMDADAFHRLQVHAPTASEDIITTLKEVLTAVFLDLTDEEWEEERLRIQLIQTIPELRAAATEELLRPLRLTFAFIAERAGLPTEHPLVRAYGGALIGGLAGITLHLDPTTHDIDFDYPTTRGELITQLTDIIDLISHIVVMPPELHTMITTHE